jgi:hypothetical protein
MRQVSGCKGSCSTLSGRGALGSYPEEAFCWFGNQRSSGMGAINSINLFCASTAMWVVEKIFGLTQPVGAPARRGVAVEDDLRHAEEVRDV